MTHSKLMKNKILVYHLIKENESVFDFLENYSFEGLLVLNNKFDLFWLNPKLSYNLGVKAANQKINLNDILDNNSINRVKDLVKKSNELNTGYFSDLNQNNNHFEPNNLTIKHSNGSLINYEVYFAQIKYNKLSFYIFGFKAKLNTSESESNIKYSNFAKIEDYLNLKNLIFHTYQFLFVINHEFKIIDYWTKNEELLFRERSEFLGVNFFELGFSKELIKNFTILFNELNYSNTPQTIEYSLLQNNHTVNYIAHISCFIKTENTKEYLVLVKDVTEEKQNKIHIEENNAKFLSIFESSNDAILISEAETGILVDANIAAEKLFNGPKEELIGMHLSKIHPPEDLEYVVSKFIEYTKTKDFKLIETKLLCLDGKIKYVEISSSLTFENNGKKYLAAYFRDITERKKNENEILKVNQRFYELAKQNNTIAWEVDKNGLYTYMSDIIENVTDYKVSDIVGKLYFYDLMPENEREKIKKIAFDIFEKKGTFNGLINKIQKQNGEFIWVETHAYPILDDNGDLIGYRGNDIDINDKKNNEDKIAIINKNNKEILNAIESSSIVSITDSKGIILKTNQLFCDISKYSSEELIGQHHNIINSGFHSRGFWVDLWKTIKSGKVWKGEIKNKAKDGSEYWVFTVITPIKDIDGKIINYFSIRNDITQKKQIELELIKRDKIFKDLNEHISGAIWQLVSTPNQKLYFQYLSYHFSEIFEVDEDLLKLDANIAFSRINSLYYDDFIESLNNSKINLTNWNFSFKIELPKKGERWLNINATPKKQPDQSIVWNGYINDITEDKLLELEIERMAYVAQNANDIIIITDANGYIEWVNNAYEKLTGYTLAEAIGKKPGSLVQGPETDKNTINIIREAINTKVPINTRILNYNKNKEKFWIDLSISPVFDSKSDVQYYVAIEKDITEIVDYEVRLLDINKNLEKLVEERTAELRLANQNLVNLNTEKDRFVGLASHDLKNPLASILLTVDLMQLKLNKNNPEILGDYTKYLTNITETSNRMNNIIMEFLNINKLQSGNFQLQKEFILLEEVCHNVLGVLDVRAKSKNIELVVEFECYNYFFLDRNSIVQISDNLISNAIKFSYPQSKVYIRCNYLDNKLYLEIEDNGQGMSDDDLNNLYNSFKKLSSKPTAGESSTGLGLSIVKYLVDLCGGQILCTSMKGKGTKFTVILPTEVKNTL